MIIRKLALAASVTALFAGGAVAQELQQSSVIEQIGGLSTARVDQSGGTEGRSRIEQIGEGHNAVVRQSNDRGDNATFLVPANVSTIFQNGNGASATVIQDGNRFAPAGGENISSVRQLSQGTPKEQVATVRQSGQQQLSTILQRGLDVQATVTQSGMGNTSRIEQNANFVEGIVTQTGDGNLSALDQMGRANNSFASVLQSGNDNVSTVLQTSLVAGPGSQNQFAVVEQGTNSNVSRITQDGGDPVFSVIDQGNRASVFQNTTSDNRSVISQSGAGNVAVVRQ